MSTRVSSSAPAIRRRAQIVRATIGVIAELGYARCSFAEIAAHGGLSSTRLISYHFSDRATLLRAVASSIVGELAATVTAAMQRTTSPRDAVHAYLRSSVAFADTHRQDVVTLAALLHAGSFGADSGEGDATEQTIAAVITAGVDAGEFSVVDPVIAADVLQRTIEGVFLRLHRTPDIDLSTLGDDLVTFFDSGLGTTGPALRRDREPA